MIRSVKSALAAGLILLIVCTAQAAPPPAIKAGSAILMDAKTGDVLYEKNMHRRSAPASTTKILTAILAIESGRLDEEVKVSPRAASVPGSSMHLYPGQILTLRELVTGLMLRSGNDAAVAIAEHLAGSEAAFVEEMNIKAQVIGAMESNFRNPHGLSAPGHYSTAFDLAWITRYALNNPIFAEIVRTKETSIDWLDPKGKEQDKSLRNTNKLLWMLEDADGVKTGTTGEAGPCLVSSATRGSQKLIAVVLHDHSRWYDSMRLLKYGFDNYDLFEFAGRGDILQTLPVHNGMRSSLDVMVDSPAALVVKAEDFKSIALELDLPEIIKAPVYQGQKVGEIIFFVGDKAVKTVDLVATEDIEERTLARIFFEHLTKLFKLLSNWGII